MWFIGLRHAVLPREQWTVGTDDHLQWMKTQHEAGNILFSGPGSFHGERLGIYLIKAPSREAAEAIAAADPFTAAGHCSYELIEWDVHQVMGAGAFTAAGIAATQ